MATGADSQLKDYTFQWQIENISHCWWLKKTECIESPPFIADAWDDTKWSLSLFPSGYIDEKYVGVQLNRERATRGPTMMEVNFLIAFLGNDGSTLKFSSLPKVVLKEGENRGFSQFVARETVFFSERESYLPEDTLTVQLTLWRTDEFLSKPKFFYNRTVFNTNRRYFVLTSKSIGTRESGKRIEFKDELIDFDIILSEGCTNLDIEVKSPVNNIKYLSCKTSIIDSCGKKENLGLKIAGPNALKSASPLWITKVVENGSRFLSNDHLSLDLEFVISTFEHFRYSNNSLLAKDPYVRIYVDKKKSSYAGSLVEDFNFMYQNGVFCDIELRTTTKVFKAHKFILGARSLVFRNMFGSGMEESKRGIVEIDVYDEDTVRRMLQYMYTESLENLQTEVASKLYDISDYYDIPSLKQKCSSFLVANLDQFNACNIFQLAKKFSDEDFKNIVQDYIIKLPKEFFRSNVWDDFMISELKIASDMMREKICSQ